jgi:hypothetical protein
MDIEITTIERSSNKPHYNDVSNTISKTSRPKNAPNNQNNHSSEKSNFNLQRWYVFL